MDFATVVEAALKLGVIPALLLFLVVSLHLQNRQLIRDRKEIETQLLHTMGQIVKEYQTLLRRVVTQNPDAERKNRNVV